MSAGPGMHLRCPPAVMSYGRNWAICEGCGARWTLDDRRGWQLVLRPKARA